MTLQWGRNWLETERVREMIADGALLSMAVKDGLTTDSVRDFGGRPQDFHTVQEPSNMQFTFLYSCRLSKRMLMLRQFGDFMIFATVIFPWQDDFEMFFVFLWRTNYFFVVLLRKKKKKKKKQSASKWLHVLQPLFFHLKSAAFGSHQHEFCQIAFSLFTVHIFSAGLMPGLWEDHFKK